MIIELTKKIKPLFMKEWELSVGEKFKVIGNPSTFVSKGIERTGYLVYTRNDRALVLYSEEVRVINRNSTKKK